MTATTLCSVPFHNGTINLAEELIATETTVSLGAAYARCRERPSFKSEALLPTSWHTSWDAVSSKLNQTSSFEENETNPLASAPQQTAVTNKERESKELPSSLAYSCTSNQSSPAASCTDNTVSTPIAASALPQASVLASPAKVVKDVPIAPVSSICSPTCVPTDSSNSLHQTNSSCATAPTSDIVSAACSLNAQPSLRLAVSQSGQAQVAENSLAMNDLKTFEVETLNSKPSLTAAVAMGSLTYQTVPDNVTFATPPKALPKLQKSYVKKQSNSKIDREGVVSRKTKKSRRSGDTSLAAPALSTVPNINVGLDNVQHSSRDRGNNKSNTGLFVTGVANPSPEPPIEPYSGQYSQNLPHTPCAVHFPPADYSFCLPSSLLANKLGSHPLASLPSPFPFFSAYPCSPVPYWLPACPGNVQNVFNGHTIGPAHNASQQTMNSQFISRNLEGDSGIFPAQHHPITPAVDSSNKDVQNAALQFLLALTYATSPDSLALGLVTPQVSIPSQTAVLSSNVEPLSATPAVFSSQESYAQRSSSQTVSCASLRHQHEQDNVLQSSKALQQTVALGIKRCRETSCGSLSPYSSCPKDNLDISASPEDDVSVNGDERLSAFSIGCTRKRRQLVLEKKNALLKLSSPAPLPQQQDERPSVLFPQSAEQHSVQSGEKTKHQQSFDSTQHTASLYHLSNEQCSNKLHPASVLPSNDSRATISAWTQRSTLRDNQETTFALPSQYPPKAVVSAKSSNAVLDSQQTFSGHLSATSYLWRHDVLLTDERIPPFKGFNGDHAALTSAPSVLPRKSYVAQKHIIEAPGDAVESMRSGEVLDPCQPLFHGSSDVTLDTLTAAQAPDKLLCTSASEEQFLYFASSDNPSILSEEPQHSSIDDIAPVCFDCPTKGLYYPSSRYSFPSLNCGGTVLQGSTIAISVMHSPFSKPFERFEDDVVTF